MKKGILWMLLSFLLVVSLVLASCAKEEVVEEEEEEEEEEVVEEEEEEEEEEEPAVGEPQYGGTLTFFIFSYGDPGTADVYKGMWPAQPYTAPVLDRALFGDFEEYGARGTNEYPFPGFGEEIPLKYSKGGLAESWEVSADEIVFHLRQGVHWAAYGKEHVMESREVTADDWVYCLNIFVRESPACGPPGWYLTENGGYIDSIYAEGRYTVVMETSRFHAAWKDMFCGWCGAIYAPEVLDADLSDWDNLVGTGAFMFKEIVPGSYVSYERNPHYWDTATINGVEYGIPFVDELVYPIIPDESTQVAALRTGKVDMIYSLPSMYEGTLAKTCPELLLKKVFMPQNQTLALNNLNEILSNKDVRRALVIAVDRQAVLEVGTGPGGECNFGPIGPLFPDAYTPIDELPASARELTVYDPVKAKQMLIDAGYPEGFKLKLVLNSEEASSIDMGSLIKEYWADIGVELELETLEPTVYARRQVAQAEAALEGGLAATLPYDCIFGAASHYAPLRGLLSAFMPSEENWANYQDEHFTAQFDLAQTTVDDDERHAILKELSVIGLDSAAYVNLGAGIELRYWWPWAKNYYGDAMPACFYFGPLIATIWIDQDLKAEMGF